MPAENSSKLSKGDALYWPRADAAKVTRWTGRIASIRSVDVRFLGNVFAGDRVECRGTVSAVDAETGDVTLDVQAIADGKPVLQGVIVVSG